MDQCSCGVDRDGRICGVCGGSIIVSGHHECEVTVESAIKWN